MTHIGMRLLIAPLLVVGGLWLHELVQALDDLGLLLFLSFHCFDRFQSRRPSFLALCRVEFTRGHDCLDSRVAVANHLRATRPGTDR